MANPLTVAAPYATFPMGPGTAGTDNISGLGNNQAKAVGVVGTTGTQYYDDLIAAIKLTSAASGVSATGSVSFYIICGESPLGGGTTPWTNNVDPISTSTQSGNLAGMTPISPPLSMTTNNTACYYLWFSIYSVVMDMPSYWSIVVYNQSGANFPATSGTNHIMRHSLVSYA